MTTFLTPHFLLSEFSTLGVAIPDALLPNIQRLADLEEAFRAAGGDFPIRNTSGYRPPWLNTLVGGEKTSQHLEAGAVDGVPLGVDLVTWARTVLASRDTLPEWGQFILEADGHFHLSLPRNNRRQVLVEVGKDKYAPWDGVGGIPPWGLTPVDTPGADVPTGEGSAATDRVVTVVLVVVGLIFLAEVW